MFIIDSNSNNMGKNVSIIEVQQLWEDYRRGDTYALARIMELYYADLFHWGMRICHDKEFIKDCLQDVFMNLHHTQNNSTKVDNVKSYLMVSVKHRIIQGLGKQRMFQQFQDTEDYEFAVEFGIDLRLIKEEEDFHNVSKLNHLVNTLPVRQREIIYLRFYQDLTFDQISEVMQLGKQSVYNLIQKAIKNLKNSWVAGWVLAVVSIEYFFS